MMELGPPRLTAGAAQGTVTKNARRARRAVTAGDRKISKVSTSAVSRASAVGKKRLCAVRLFVSFHAPSVGLKFGE